MKLEFSAGGVVFKKVHSARQGLQVFILVAQHSGHHGWVFPKGFIGDHIENESKQETALREVREETGVTAKILKPLAPITYFYQEKKEKHKKTVYYYLMGFVSGDITKHDFEMENVEWLEKEKVKERLTYPSEKKVWQEAQKLL